MGRIEENKERLFAAIDKPLNEIIAEFKRRQVGAEERLERARGAVDRYGEALGSAQWVLLKLFQDREFVDRLPEEWRMELGVLKSKLKAAEIEVKSLRDRDGW